MFRVARKIRVGRETGNIHIFFLGLFKILQKKKNTLSTQTSSMNMNRKAVLQALRNCPFTKKINRVFFLNMKLCL